MIFTDEDIQQVLRSDNWSVTKDLPQIADSYNYRIEPISAENAKMFIPIRRIISKKALNLVYTTIQRLDRLRRKLGKVPFFYLKHSRNLNRKSKSHFRK